MKTEIISTKTNPLIGRREVAFKIIGQATPSRAEVRRELAVLLKVDLEKVWVKRMETKTGTNRTVGLVHIYEDAEKAIQVEPEYIIKRNQQTGEGK